jgi:hypothetical protein
VSIKLNEPQRMFVVKCRFRVLTSAVAVGSVAALI